MYCIYTDQEISKQNGNMDHIFPLSLGGHDEFCLWSNRDFNSKVGSKVDGKLANDPLVMLARRDADAKGHSGKSPVPIWKKSEIENTKVQVSLGKEKIEFFNVKTKEKFEPAYDGTVIKSQMQIDIYAPLRFAAKAALAGAYFIYGSAIKTAINCNDLRTLIAFDAISAKNDDSYLKSNIQICDRFHEDAAPNSGNFYRFFCEMQRRSIFISVPHEDTISFHVGVLGMYMCSLTVPCDTKDLPTGIDHDYHDLGHVILLAPGNMERMSFRKLALLADGKLKELKTTMKTSS